MVGAAPVCPPERPRSGVSMHKGHVPTCKESISIRKGHVPTRKGGVSIRKRHIHIRKSGVSIHKRCMLISKYVCAFADGCALAGRHGRAHRHRPYQPPSNPSTTQSSLFLPTGIGSSGNLITRTIREMVGAAPVCQPERPRSGVSIRKGHVLTRKSGVSIRKRHVPHAKEPFPFINNACSHQNMFVHCTDGCALAGRRGRAHRHRPYQPPSNHSATQSSSF